MEKLGKTTNALNWFEIPITDVARAKKFYETAFDIEMQQVEMYDSQMLMFPCEEPRSSGALVKSKDHKPSSEGCFIYLNGNPDLQLVLDRVEGAGGKIVMPKTNIGENGNMGFFMDTEGNTVGVHSEQ